MAATTLRDEQTSPEDKELFLHALEMFFGAQHEDGSWSYSRPLFHYPKVGNAYCFEYELLTQLLSCTPLRSELLPYIPKMALAAYRLEKIGFDLDSSRPSKVVAWASGHHPQIAGPESWSTASVYDFAHALDRLVAEAVRRSIFNELGLIYSPPISSKSIAKIDAFAKDFLDADLTLPSGDVLSLRKTIAAKFVLPISNDAYLVERGGRLGSRTPMSAILFGPPGTSKTQLAKLISRFLGWPLISLDPSYLVKDGLDRIQALANRLFSMLALAEQVVVLLDEFDEMGRDRSRNQALLSRFITTAMLPKLALINSERKIVFLLATNFVSGFDAAFSRGGRFDLLVQIMPPNLNSKLSHWPTLKKAYNKLSAKQKKAADTALTELTFLECEQLVSKLSAATKAEQIMDEITAAHKAGTLSQPNTIDQPAEGQSVSAEASTTTWKITSDIERARIRGV